MTHHKLIDVAWNEAASYLLQPGGDQAVSIAKMIKRGDPLRKLVGVLLRSEQNFNSVVYDEILTVNSYAELPAHLTIIPTGASSTEALLVERDVILGHITMSRNVLAVYDKNKFLAICHQENLPIPITYSAVKDIPLDAYPIFYKQAYEKGGGIRGIAYSVKDVPAHIEGTLIFQEYINSVGTYGVGFLADKGRVLVTHLHFERESYPKSGGSAVIIETVDAPELLDLTKRIVSALDYSGWGLAEFKYNPNSKKYVFMEVNAKFWASCCFAFENEPAFPKYLFNVGNAPKKIQRQFFINRGFARGLFFMLRYLLVIMRSERVYYPGLARDFVRGFAPEFALQFVRKMRARTIN